MNDDTNGCGAECADGSEIEEIESCVTTDDEAPMLPRAAMVARPKALPGQLARKLTPAAKAAVAKNITVTRKGRKVVASVKFTPPHGYPTVAGSFYELPIVAGTRIYSNARVDAATGCIAAVEGVMAKADSDALLLQNLKNLPPNEQARILMSLSGRNRTADDLLARVYERAAQGDADAIAVAENLAVKVGEFIDTDNVGGEPVPMPASLAPYLPTDIQDGIKILGGAVLGAPAMVAKVREIVAAAKAGNDKAQGALLMLQQASQVIDRTVVSGVGMVGGTEVGGFMDSIKKLGKAIDPTQNPALKSLINIIPGGSIITSAADAAAKINTTYIKPKLTAATAAADAAKAIKDSVTAALPGAAPAAPAAAAQQAAAAAATVAPATVKVFVMPAPALPQPKVFVMPKQDPPGFWARLFRTGVRKGQ